MVKDGRNKCEQPVPDMQICSALLTKEFVKELKNIGITNKHIVILREYIDLAVDKLNLLADSGTKLTEEIFIKVINTASEMIRSLIETEADVDNSPYIEIQWIVQRYTLGTKNVNRFLKHSLLGPSMELLCKEHTKKVIAQSTILEMQLTCNAMNSSLALHDVWHVHARSRPVIFLCEHETQ